MSVKVVLTNAESKTLRTTNIFYFKIVRSGKYPRNKEAGKEN